MAMFLLEAARASALAAHSAAGLCVSAKVLPAARLLRAAEALSRAAVAQLQEKKAMGNGAGAPLLAGAGGAAAGALETPEQKSRKKRRRTRTRKKGMDGQHTASLAQSPSAPELKR